MDATQYAEGSFVNPEVVKNSATKKAVITGVKEQEGKFGKQLCLSVEMDGKKKEYSPSKDSVKNIMQVLGKETNAWLGKILEFQVLSVAGKERVIASVAK